MVKMDFIIIVMALTLVSCKQDDDIKSLKPLPLPEINISDTTLRYLALGDSYTIGQDVSEAECWPVQLVEALKEEGVSIDLPRIIARTGWATDELSLAIDKEQIKDTFNIVSLLIGVNNQYRGRSAESFRPEFNALLGKAVAFAGNDTSRVFVLSIPDWGVTPFADGRDRDKIAREIDAFNAVIKEETALRNILFFDITPISREAASDLSLLAPDQLHPSGIMYNRWVNELLPALLLKLKKP